MDVDLEEALNHAAETQPYPIAAACAEVQAAEPRDDWHEWELLSRDLLTPVLTYLSHLLLSDLVATGREPAHLFHRIESILSRPLAGHYVGFLRETARYYREEEVESAVPELIEFLLAADVDEELLAEEKPFLGTLVHYRNLWAHGRIENEEVVAENLQEIRGLTARLLEDLSFLTDYPLTREDGTVLMGADAPLSESPEPLVVISAGEVALRPLLLKLEGADLMMLSDLDLGQRRLDYRGQEAFVRFTEEDIEEDGEAHRVFQELKDLVDEVRALEAPLPAPDWDSFKQRTNVETDRMLTLYGEENTGKYVPDLFVPRPRWEGEDNPFSEFMESEKSLLAITGDQGKGKSALAGRLATRCREAGHATWLVNGQRFTFADVTWSGTPYPRYFAERLSYKRPFDRRAIERIVDSAPEGRKAVLLIDAVNEVDGIEAKWNRFRAMRLLLEWIVEVAQPGLKVVLTFRMEAYEEFDALGPEEWPEGLEKVTYPGDHPRKPWALELEPFGSEQARRLYERLQEEPERGMAPQMRWEQVRDGLGEELETFTANPLLYQIFLKAHNGRTSILTTDQEELFERYAEKVTGRAEARKRPWWKKTWAFIKNGDILPKERIVSDIVDKMSNNGSNGVILSFLSPHRNRKDKRIKQSITGCENVENIDKLQEGGILSISNLEKGDVRVTLTDKLARYIHGSVHKNVETRRSIFNSTKVTLIGLSVMMFLLILTIYNLYIHTGGKAVATISKGIFLLGMTCALPLLFFLYLSYLGLSIGISKHDYAKFDPVLSGTKKRIDKKLDRQAKKIGLYTLCINCALCVLFFAVNMDFLITVVPLIVSFSFLMVYFIPYVGSRSINFIQVNSPLRIIMSTSRTINKHTSFSTNTRGYLISIIMLTTGGLWLLGSYFSFQDIFGYKAYSPYGLLYNYIVNAIWISLVQNIIYVMFALFIVSLVPILLPHVLSYYHKSTYQYIMSSIGCLGIYSSYKKYLYVCVPIFVVSISALISLVLSQPHAKRTNANSFEKFSSQSIDYYRSKTQKVDSVSITGSISPATKDFVYSLDEVSSLHIRDDADVIIDGTRLSSLKSFYGPANKIHFPSSSTLSSVTVTSSCPDIKSWSVQPLVTRISLQCKVLPWKLVNSRFPILTTVRFDVLQHRNLNYMKYLDENTILSPFGKSVENIVWFNDVAPTFIVRPAGVDSTSSILPHLRRIVLPISDTNDCSIIKRLSSAKWIHISSRDPGNVPSSCLLESLPQILSLSHFSIATSENIYYSNSKMAFKDLLLRLQP